MASKIVTTTEEIKSRKASYVPGDDLRALIAPMRDEDGHLWMPGTKYRPLSHGNSGRTITLIGIPDEKA